MDQAEDDADKEILTASNVKLGSLPADRELMKPDEQGRYFAVSIKTASVRKLEYKDIVVLLRTTKNWAEVFREEFTQEGIPSFADTGTGFFKTSEVQVMLSLLQIIDNPLQDIPLLAVLRSPLVGFTTDELAELRLAKRKGPLYEAVKSLAQTAEENATEGAATSKAFSFLKDLMRWQEMSLYMSRISFMAAVQRDRLLWNCGAMRQANRDRRTSVYCLNGRGNMRKPVLRAFSTSLTLSIG
jgi:ATP-dependent helicase/nuclease subunit A